MLKIRDEQMQALGDPMESRFVDGLVEFLREQFADARICEPAEIRPEVARQVERARGHGFAAKEHLATYVTAAWLLGQDFDERFPAAKRMLADASYTPADKSDWLAEWTERMFAELERRDG